MAENYNSPGSPVKTTSKTILMGLLMFGVVLGMLGIYVPGCPSGPPFLDLGGRTSQQCHPSSQGSQPTRTYHEVPIIIYRFMKLR